MDVYIALKECEDLNNKTYAYLYVPDKDLRSKVTWGKTRVPIPEIKKILETSDTETTLCLTTPIQKSPTTYIHPIVDVDYKSKQVFMDKDERCQIAKNIVAMLNSANICGFKNWRFSIRDGNNSGIHLYHKYVKVKVEDYYNLLLRIKQTLDSDTWTVDDKIQNITLPNCGKLPSSEYVYKDPFGNPDPWLWCTDSECKGYSVSRPREKINKNDISVTKSTTLSEYSERSEEFSKDMFHENTPTCCTPENALMYSVLFPNEEDGNDAYNSAIYIQKYLQSCNEKDTKDACIVESLLTNTKCILNLHRSRGIYISDSFFNKFIEAYESGCVSNIYLLMSLQFPIYIIEDGLYIYTEKGWIKEPISYVKFLITTILDFAKQQCNNKIQISVQYMKIFMETYWAFDQKLINQKKDFKYLPNHVVCTKDFYLYTKHSTAFIKSTVLHPYFIGQTCKYTRDQLENGKKLFDDAYPKILEIFENLYKVQDGTISFVTLFKRDDFMDCPILSCIYFLITYFNFDVPSIKFFLNTMHQILFGLTKRIIIMVGESANNGKTTLSKIISEAFGNLCGVFNDAELVKNTSMTSPDFLRNAQKKITFLDESGDLKLDINVLKRITSNGLSSSRTLFKSTEIVKCLTNFMMCGNSKPILNVDQGLKKRIRCFELSSEFGYHPEPVAEYLSTPHKYSDTNPQFKKFGFNEENMGFGFLVLIMYMRPFDVDNVKNFQIESSIAFFTRKHIELESGAFSSLMDVEECIEYFASANSIDANQLRASFINKYKKYMDQTGFSGVKIKK